MFHSHFYWRTDHIQIKQYRDITHLASLVNVLGNIAMETTAPQLANDLE